MGGTAYPAGLIDTDILIDASRGLPEAGAFLDEQQEGAGILISVISAMELIGGCRDAAQLREVQRFLQQVTVLPLTTVLNLITNRVRTEARFSCLLGLTFEV